MANFLLDTLDNVGYALDTPGAYLRGALAGKVGSRASGEDLLSSYGVQGGGLGGLAAEMVVDPLTLLPPVWGAYKGGKALGKGLGLLDDASPLGRSLGGFLADETAAVRMPGEAGYDVAREAFEANRHLISKKNPDAFFDAIEPLGLGRDAEDTIFDMRHKLETYGDPYPSTDRMVSQGMRDAGDFAGEDFFSGESGALDPRALLERLTRKSPLDRRLAELGAQVDPMDRLRYDYRQGPGGINPLEEALSRFPGEELGALDLKFDLPGLIRAEQKGLSRSDPEWVNNRTFYHGTGTAGLGPQDLDPLKTSLGNLHGQGIYTTDEASFLPDLPITSGYRTARAGDAMDYDTLGRHLDDLHAQWTREARAAGYDSIVARPELHDLQAARPDLFRGETYQSQSDFGRILDLDEVPPEAEFNRMADAIRELVMKPADAYKSEEMARMARKRGDLVSGKPSSYFTGRVDELYEPDLERLLDRAREASTYTRSRQGHSPLLRALKELGYDAMTHTGGQRTGKDYHQVVIGLDPNDVIGMGRRTPYKIWEPFR